MGFFAVAALLGLSGGASKARADADAQPEVSLARLLIGPPAPPDADGELGVALAQLDKRPLAQFAAAALQEAHTALASLPSLRAHAASNAVVERRKQLLWSLLLLADRLIARAEVAAALRGLQLRADQAAADAAIARQMREAALLPAGQATP